MTDCADLQSIMAEMYKVPGHFEYNGVIYSMLTRPDVLTRIQDQFEFRDDDILLASFPKSGTTWIQTVLYLLSHPDELRERSLSRPVQAAIPFLEICRSGIPELDNIESLPSPRIFKTHLPFELLEQQLRHSHCKVVVVQRNPKDSLVSFFHFYRMNALLGNFSGTWSEFFDLFVKKRLVFGDWFDITLGWWTKKDDPRFMFIKYEDLKKNPKPIVQKLAEFCGKGELLADDLLERIVEMTTFEQIKGNPMTNMSFNPAFKQDISPFMRKGIVGDWKNYFTVSQNEYFDDVYRDRIRNTGLHFEFEL